MTIITLLLYFINPLLLGLLIDLRDFSIVKKYILGTVLSFAVYGIIAYIDYFLPIKLPMQLLPLLYFSILAFILVKNKRNVKVKNIIELNDIGFFVIACATVTVFLISTINYKNGHRFPVFSQSWDSWSHLNIGTILQEKNGGALFKEYPILFHINYAILSSLVNQGNSDNQDIVITISVYSLYTIYIFNLVTCLFYILLLLVIQNNKRIDLLSYILIALVTFFSVSNPAFSLFKHGFFSLLFVCIFFILFIIAHLIKSRFITFISLVGVSQSYIFLFPILIIFSILLNGLKQRTVKTVMFQILVLAVFSFPFLLNTLAKFKTVGIGLLVNLGAYDSYTNLYYLFSMMFIIVFQYLFNKYYKKDSRIENIIVYLVISMLIFIGIIGAAQFASIGKLSYSFFKPLMFMRIFINYLVEVYVVLIILRVKNTASIPTLLANLLVIVGIYIFTIDKPYIKSLILSNKDEFQFLSADMYNESVYIREVFNESRKSTLMVLSYHEYLWTSYIIADARINKVQKEVRLTNNEINQKLIERLDGVDTGILVYDPHHNVNYCNSKVLDAFKSNRITYVPKLTFDNILIACKLKK